MARWSEDNSMPVAPFRQRYQELRARGEISPSDLAKRMGYYHRDHEADTSRAMRALGLQRKLSGTSRAAYRNERVSLETAELLALALNLDPVEVGL